MSGLLIGTLILWLIIAIIVIVVVVYVVNWLYHRSSSEVSFVRTGFLGEMRFGLLNDLRPGEKALPRMVDRCAALALPKGAALPADWPLPKVSPATST